MSGPAVTLHIDESTLDTIVRALDLAEANAYGADSRENYRLVGRRVAAAKDQQQKKASS